MKIPLGSAEDHQVKAGLQIRAKHKLLRLPLTPEEALVNKLKQICLLSVCDMLPAMLTKAWRKRYAPASALQSKARSAYLSNSWHKPAGERNGEVPTILQIFAPTHATAYPYPESPRHAGHQQVCGTLMRIAGSCLLANQARKLTRVLARAGAACAEVRLP